MAFNVDKAGFGCRASYTSDATATVAQHHFTQRLEVFVPSLSVPESVISSLSSHAYFSCLGPIAALLTQPFIDSYVRRGSLFVVSATAPSSSSVGSSNRFAILPTGRLVITLDRESYQTLGIEGRRSDMDGKCLGSSSGAHRVVEIDLKAPSFIPGKRLHDRVLWCLSRDRVTDASFIACWVDADGVARDIVFPSEVTFAKRIPLSVSRVALGSVHQPTAAALAAASHATKHDQECVPRLMEWAGLISLRASNGAAKMADDWERFLDGVEITRAAGTIVTAQGLIPSHLVRAVMELLRESLPACCGPQKWCSVLAKGFASSPVGWANCDHEPFMGGENDILSFLVDGVSTPFAVCAVGAHDSYTGP